MSTSLSLLLLTVALGAPLSSRAEPLVLTSGPKAVPLVELFTSQGCSSCPPADAWLSGLADRADLWHAFVPLAWHVDYWDGLGWADRFANPRYSARQRAYRDSGAVHVVYTPGMFLAGKEWTRWRRTFAVPATDAEEAGTLELKLNGDRAELAFEPAPGRSAAGLQAHLAVLGMGLRTPVPRGENGGRTLREDFVVLGVTHAGEKGRTLSRWRLPLPDADRSGTERLAVAAWISRGEDPRPLQAVGGWLPQSDI